MIPCHFHKVLKIMYEIFQIAPLFEKKDVPNTIFACSLRSFAEFLNVDSFLSVQADKLIINNENSGWHLRILSNSSVFNFYFHVNELSKLWFVYKRKSKQKAI